LIEDGHARESNGKWEVDLGKAGYTKLLGDGHIAKPFRITVAEYSKRAAEKVSQAGGEIISPSKQKEG